MTRTEMSSSQWPPRIRPPGVGAGPRHHGNQEGALKLGLRGRLIVVAIPILLVVIGTATTVTVMGFQRGNLPTVQSRLEAIATPLVTTARSYLAAGNQGQVLSIIVPNLRVTVGANTGAGNAAH